MRSMLTIVILSLGAAARAQTAAPESQAAFDQLKAAQQGQASQVFDGVMRRREGPLEIVSEQKGALLKEERVPSRRDCDYSDAGVYDGPGHGHPGIGRSCTTIAAHTERTYGDIQTVRIADRDAYVHKEGNKGALIGGLIGAGIGALGFLALFAGPIGWAVGAIAVAVGAGAGAYIGSTVAENNAKKEPEVFNRVVNKHEVDSAS